MAGYLGNTQKISGSYTVDEFTSSGGTTYTLTKTPGAKNNIQVSAGGLVQYPSAYSVSGTTLTLSGVPSGQKVVVRHMGDTIPYPLLDANSVDSAELVAGSVDDAHLATGISASKLTGALPAISGASLTNLPAGGDSRNFIIDGATTQWPEGTGATTTVNNTYSSALIKMAFSHDGATTWERSTDVPTASTTVPEFEYSHLTKCTGTDASIASGQHMLLRYHITGSDFKYLHKKQVTFSFWAKTAAANSGDTVSVGLNNSAYNRGYVFTFTPTSTWTKFTETITMDASGTWLFTEADLGLSVVFVLAVGSTYHASSDDTWEGSNVWGSSSNSNFMDSTSNEFYITGLSVVLGSSAPSVFLGEPISTVQDQVNYYVQKFAGDVQYQRFAMGLMTSATLGYFSVRFYKPMRRIPDIAWEGGGWQVQSGTGYDSSVTLSAAQIGKDGFRMGTNSLTATGGSFVDNSPIEMYSSAAASYILADARH